MTPDAANALEQLKTKLLPASIAEVGGFRPPDDPLTSWFLKGCMRVNEKVPMWSGKPMFPLLQIRVDELPFIPVQLKNIALLVLYYNLERHVFDKPHGEGWLIREYSNLDGLRPLPEQATPYRAFPLRWHQINDDSPGWEDAGELIDMTAINTDKAACECFFDNFSRYSNTKVGGYPKEIQHNVGIEDFVFQIGSEDKVKWMWVDNGMGYFHRSAQGIWRFSCQFY